MSRARAPIPVTRGPGVDATTVLTAYVILLIGIPSVMKFPPLGSAGSPCNVLALAAFLWWLWFHVHRTAPLGPGHEPIRITLLVWLVVMFVVYAHAMASPLPPDEISPADSGMLRLLGCAGILLVANDGVRSAAQARKVMSRLVVGAGLLAVVGIVQFATKELWIDRLSIPGLTSVPSTGLAVRNGIVRPNGTSTHPIEFGVVLTMTLPLAVAHARRAPAARWFYSLLVGVMGVAIILAISRSAIICGGVAMLVMLLYWPNATRARALVSMAGVFSVVYVMVPGVLGTVTNLFTGFSEDTSVQSRTGSYEVAWLFFRVNPVIGRGFGTFLPKYWIFDNGYLGLLVEGGVLGLLGLLVLIVLAAGAAHRAVAHLEDDFDRELARAVCAAIVAGGAALAFFDTFAFAQSAGWFFLMMGLAGAWFRISRTPAPDTPAPVAPERRTGPRHTDVTRE